MAEAKPLVSVQHAIAHLREERRFLRAALVAVAADPSAFGGAYETKKLSRSIRRQCAEVELALEMLSAPVAPVEAIRIRPDEIEPGRSVCGDWDRGLFETWERRKARRAAEKAGSVAA